jgi:hypothetical protein
MRWSARSTRRSSDARYIRLHRATRTRGAV